MQISFTKMQGAGNDFVVLDETRRLLGLSPSQYRWLADRHFGIGADQVLSVRASPAPGIDFEYVIHNADGGEVGQCGNGARCFMRFVHERGLTQKPVLRVRTRSGVIAPRINADGSICVDMGVPLFDLTDVGFDSKGLTPKWRNGFATWPLALSDSTVVQLSLVCMGNPHAVLVVDDIDAAPVPTLGPQIEGHARFAHRVNAGFMQVQDPEHVRLRVYERGAGETLACGSGACAAVVAGIRLGLLAPSVQVQARGGSLRIDWAGAEQAQATVSMSGPAQTVFEGVIDIPETFS